MPLPSCIEGLCANHPRARGRLKAFAPIALVAMLMAAGHASVIPDRLSDQQFWSMVTGFSEPNGYFLSENFVSNEDAFQWPIPELRRRLQPGGVYLGVGPDQNFTYIAALAPRIAFIVDIRRGNLQELLMYKALIEMAPDRATFLSLLCSRPRPTGLDSGSTAKAMLDAVYFERPDSALYARTLAAVDDRLTRVHGWPLSAEDSAGIRVVFSAFFTVGPWLTYNGNAAHGGTGEMPGYADLQAEVDGQGVPHAYLATEANYRALRDIESRNLIVPIVGDFAGPKALRAVASYLRDNHATVSAIYVSNVEQYLFEEGDAWQRYYATVATLPIDSASVFIRSLPAMGGLTPQYQGRSVSVLCSVAALNAAVAAKRVTQYADLAGLCR